MARISSYPYDIVVQDSDAWIGSDSVNRQTKQYTAEAVARYLNIKGKISIAAQMVFKFVVTPIPGSGEFSGPADGAAINTVTTLEISGIDASSQNTVQFMEYLVNNDIIISQQNEISVFGHFKMDSYTLNGGVYTLALTYIGGNGTLIDGNYYDLAVFTLSSRSSDLTFIFNQAVPATVWNITHNLGKFPSVSVVNSNNLLINGEITYIDDNNLTCNFSAAFAGKAYLN
jgi:hypothetical protein